MLAEAAEAGLLDDAVTRRARPRPRFFWHCATPPPPAERAKAPPFSTTFRCRSRPCPASSPQPARIEADRPGTSVVAFGHLGDGNIHLRPRLAGVTDPAGFGRRAMARRSAGRCTICHRLAARSAPNTALASSSAKSWPGWLDPARLSADACGVAPRSIRRLLNPGKLVNSCARACANPLRQPAPVKRSPLPSPEGPHHGGGQRVGQ